MVAESSCMLGNAPTSLRDSLVVVQGGWEQGDTSTSPRDSLVVMQGGWARGDAPMSSWDSLVVMQDDWEGGNLGYDNIQNPVLLLLKHTHV